MRQIINMNANWVFSKAAEAVPSVLPTDWEIGRASCRERV